MYTYGRLKEENNSKHLSPVTQQNSKNTQFQQKTIKMQISASDIMN